MPEKILDRIRRLNWVLTESTTGSLSYDQLSKILSEVINANVYLTDAAGSVLGTGYINAEDTSTEVDEKGGERIPEYHNDNFMKMDSTSANITGKQALDIMGDSYAMADKYHCIVPSFCGGDRLGTLIVTRYNRKFSEEDIALCEYGAAVAGLEIRRNLNLAEEREKRQISAIHLALATLSFSEKEAVKKILREFSGGEGSIVTSKVAEKYKMTNSLVVNALRKLESAGVLTSRSMGMKGTKIQINNLYLRDVLEEIR